MGDAMSVINEFLRGYVCIIPYANSFCLNLEDATFAMNLNANIQLKLLKEEDQERKKREEA